MAPMTTLDDHEPPEWNEDDAQRIVGARVLIGITRLLPDGATQEQMHGLITSADRAKGFSVTLAGARDGETYWLPPDLRNFSSAAPGEYRLRSTGETVVNPDFISTWTIEAPAN